MQFYLDGLPNSNEFSLLLGCFSSSAINLLSVGFATFITKGGKMRMVINHLLSAKDKEAISRVEDNPNHYLQPTSSLNINTLHKEKKVTISNNKKSHTLSVWLLVLLPLLGSNQGPSD